MRMGGGGEIRRFLSAVLYGPGRAVERDEIPRDRGGGLFDVPGMRMGGRGEILRLFPAVLYGPGRSVKRGEIPRDRGGGLFDVPGMRMGGRGEILRLFPAVFLRPGRAVERDEIPGDRGGDYIRLARVQRLNIFLYRRLVCRREIAPDNIALCPRARGRAVVPPLDGEDVPGLCRHEDGFRRGGIRANRQNVRRVRQDRAVEDGYARVGGRESSGERGLRRVRLCRVHCL